MKKERTLFATDECLIVSTGLIDRESYQSLYHLYQPVIGIKALALYQTLWSELNPGKMKSHYMTHTALCQLLDYTLDEFSQGLHKLEAIGLVRTYQAKDSTTQYVYQLRVPLAPHTFLNDGVLSSFLFYKVGEVRFKQLQGRFTIDPLPAGLVEVTKGFNEVFDVKGVNERAFVQQANYEKPDRANIEIDYRFDMDVVKRLTNFPVGFFTKKVDETIIKLAYVSQVDEETMANMLKEYFVHEAYLPLTEQEKRDGCRQMVLQLKKKPVRHRKEKMIAEDVSGTIDVHDVKTMEDTHPHQYISALRKTPYLSKTDEQLLFELVDTLGLNPSVINALFFYCIEVKQQTRLSENFVMSVATSWKTAGYMTASEALEREKQQDLVVEKRQQQREEFKRKTVGSKKAKTEGAPAPAWLEREEVAQRAFEEKRQQQLSSSIPDDDELVRLLNQLKEKG